MSAFTPEWLALREPVDAASRAPRLVEALAEHTAGGARRDVVDLGAGTGAALRYLAPRLGGEQRWRLVDSDGAVLLAARRELCTWARDRGASLHDAEAGGQSRRATAGSADRGSGSGSSSGDDDDDGSGGAVGTAIEIRAASFACTVQLQPADLAAGLDPVARLPGAVVSASALLDLASARWLDALVEACRAGRHPALLTLSFDGRIELDPSDPLDARIRAAFDRDQRRDKGLGPALGPDAAAYAARAFRAAGFGVETATSDWLLEPGSARLTDALIRSYMDVARRHGAAPDDALEAWRRERAGQLADGTLGLRVGHIDLLALPPE